MLAQDDKAKARELERQKLIRAAELKQARLRKESANWEADMQAEANKASLQDEKTKREQSKNRELIMANLQKKADLIRKQVDRPAKTMKLDETVDEIHRINKLIEKLETDFTKSLKIQLQPINEHYQTKITKAKTSSPGMKCLKPKLISKPESTKPNC